MLAYGAIVLENNKRTTERPGALRWRVLSRLLHEDVPRRPGVSIVTSIALDYPKGPNWMADIVRDAGPPSLTNGKRPWTVALWCFGFKCSNMERTVRDYKSPPTLLVDRQSGFTLNDAGAVTNVRIASAENCMHTASFLNRKLQHWVPVALLCFVTACTHQRSNAQTVRLLNGVPLAPNITCASDCRGYNVHPYVLKRSRYGVTCLGNVPRGTIPNQDPRPQSYLVRDIGKPGFPASRVFKRCL